MAVGLNIIMTALLLLFVFYITLVYKSKVKGLLFVGKGIIYIMSFLGHGYIIYVNGYSNERLILFLLQLVAITLFTFVVEKIKFLEPLVWQIVCMLFVVGSIMLHRLNFDYAYRQTIIFIGAILITYIIGLVAAKITLLDRFSWLYGLLTIGILLMSNSTSNGATNWFEYGGISFQPSEFAKITFTFFLASTFRKTYQFTTLFFVTVVSAVIVLIPVTQSDLGSSFIFFALYMMLSYMYSRKRMFTLVQFTGLVVGGWIAYEVFSHVRIRVLAWLEPFKYIEKEGYQIAQGLFAFSNGKWFGSGLLEGQPKDIPIVDSDFIIAAIGEELGTIFTVLLIVLYMIFVVILISQCQKTKDLFNAYIGVGLSVLFGLQGFLIIGGVLKLIPLTGVTFPFVSNGGTSLFVSVIMVGLIDGISKAKQKSEEQMYRAHTLITLKLVMVVMYCTLITFFLYYIVVSSDETELNAYNKRMDSIEKTIVRGSIYDANGVELVYSVMENGEVARYYPFDNMYAHVIGYNDLDKSGIELQLNVDLLSDHLPILDQLSVAIKGEEKQGSDIYLSLDSRLQEIAYNHLEGKKGAVIAIEPSTGKILAMVSKPDFDPNTILDNYQELITREDGVLLNRATNGVYPPGSTFKILTALSYIEQNGEDFYYFCKGVDIFGNKYLHCYGDTAHGRMDLPQAFAMSCNTSFATMAEKMSMDELQVLAERLLFNKDLPYMYPYKGSTYFLENNSSKELRAETVIGQGETLMSPLHNLLITQAIANDGLLMEPYLVTDIVNSKGDVVESFYPIESEQLLTEDEADILKELMTLVVTDGTGKALISDEYSAAGKTGSAENPFGDTHAWFVGFAPVNHPKIAICVIVENSGSSGQNAIPIVKDMFDAYLIKD